MGSVPEFYDRYMVPLIFEPYANDLATRVRALAPTDVLEVAAGSGVVTRALAAGLNESVSITATDLNQPMLDHAEVARVLRPGGTYLFSVWDAIEQNEFVHVVERSLAELFPSDPPRFMSRTPHGYHDDAVLRADLAMCGGFASVTIDTVDAHSRAATCHIPARAYLEGTPLRAEVEALDPNGLAVALEVSAAALTQRFGSVDPVGKIRGFVVTATKSGLLPTVESGFLADIEPRE